ncbi:hypothetical protein [Streptomyces sp. MP131-18]|uniref:hypothetical protein n=1 Tax=Streptomyces sp. MP131-18 TaxID=1857892 RepID=UPI00097C7FFD|nr:hypothetical protein [Streptomyces sp. MP131-18]ONK13259.1 hypothetical protein STBA_40220 [Streptomyces sp. MP131-18]
MSSFAHGTPAYWDQMTRVAAAVVHRLDDTVDVMRAAQTVHDLYAERGLLHVSACLLAYAHLECPFRLLGPDRRPDASRLLARPQPDALTALTTTSRVNQLLGRSAVTATNISDTEEQINAFDAAEPLARAALAAAPEIRVMAVALEPADGDRRVTSCVYVYALIAVRAVLETATT